jgi:hypothetical protein
MIMTAIYFQTHVSESGVITLPPQAKSLYGKAVMVNVDQSFDDDEQVDPARTLPNGKTAVDDFLDFCKELNLPPMTDEDDWQPDPTAVRRLFERRIAVEITDEEIEKLKHERRMRKML